ncbi:MAG: hypothetical protein QXS85_01395 [Acidilobaceae archaeon]
MFRARYLVRVPAILAGVPIPGSRNPFIAAPLTSLRLDVELRECDAPRVEARGVSSLEDRINSLWSNLLENMGLRFCSRVELAEEGRVEETPLGGLYASVSSALYYALGEAHGEKLSPRDIVESLSLAEPMSLDESERTLVDSLRYSASSGSVVAYRDVDEVYEFKTVKLRSSISVKGRVYRQASALSRDALSIDLYSSLVHLAGLAVLEIAEEVRDGVELLDAIARRKQLLDAIAIAVWDLEKPPRDCLWSPSLPGLFELLCVEEWRRGV